MFPEGKRAIASKWVYKVKFNADRTVERFKARVVVKGYNQLKGVDYDQSFSPVAKAVTVRVFFFVAAMKAWPLHQVDINNAFLHGFLEEELYMTPPKGYLKAKNGEVYRLKKSLYGLKQASRQWNVEFTNHLESFGFEQSNADMCLFTYDSDKGSLLLFVYVDDLLIAGSTEKLVTKLKQSLHKAFKIKDLGYAKFFLGLEVARSP